MGFLVTPSAKLLGACIIRLTNLQIAAGQTGVIGVAGDSTADFQLPAGWPPSETLPAGIALADVVSFQWMWVAAGTTGGHLHVNKTTAPVTNTFRLAMLNDTSDSIILEAYLRFFHSAER